MKDTTETRTGDADAGVRMLYNAVEDYRAVVTELEKAARAAWAGPQVTPEELADTVGTVTGFNPGAVLDRAVAVPGPADQQDVGENLRDVVGRLGEDGPAQLIAEQLTGVVEDYLTYCAEQGKAVEGAARAMSANATLCRMSGEAAGVTVRATLSVIRAQTLMIYRAHTDGDWDTFRDLVGTAATLVDECAHEIWGLCVDRDETMCEGLNHLMAIQSAIAGVTPPQLSPAAEILFNPALSHPPPQIEPDPEVTTPGAGGEAPVAAGVDALSCTGILGALGVGVALLGADMIADLADGSPEPLTDTTGDTVPQETPPPAPDITDGTGSGHTEPVESPETAPEGPAPAPVPEPDRVEPRPAPETGPPPEPGPAAPVQDTGDPVGTTRKAGRW
ncbi:hypothetical protein [Corynebacterium pygosceleis]|uniref:Uncharacterized protein n=1 Tax=Corynebacterium pygosceleis TaxID=2800406 RepID=A0A9Q4C871_9CORY|nr:hypothetical protein [Corynebacterium pygosceleis]MCK7637565.1 hypothetical protein [Corynebacterium pygosceleis]MCK7674756.1 hypothetical protein [Corynebacterium pygosceleis]MCL0119655.1 hypothetical protein [Corynebacterium pygosceleis]MCX7468106.1 hypothetical protein [Corynebacterium pygosceleis]